MSTAVICDCCGSFAPAGKKPRGRLPEEWLRLEWSGNCNIVNGYGDWKGNSRVDLCPCCRFIDPRDEDFKCPHSQGIAQAKKK